METCAKRIQDQLCKPPVLRVHPEIADLIADEMDVLSLSRWKTVCRDTYIHASSSSRRTLTKRLNVFTTHPHQLVDIVKGHGAVFGGELALSFMLRTQSFALSYLDIYAGYSQFSDLCDAVLESPGFRNRVEKHSFNTTSIFHAARRMISDSLIIRLTDGHTVYIHRSYTNSPSAPITRAPCTALSNFVTAYGFGCSHPGLTLARRALLADRELLHLSTFDAHSLDRVISFGFSLAVSPTAWPEYRREVDRNTPFSPEECWRDRFVCPNQGRFFGDKGSFVAFFDPLGDDETDCIKANVAPFGPMVIWRLLSTFECHDGCMFLDEVLEQGVTSVPVLFREDPVGELRECDQDRIARCHRFYRLFGTPASPVV